MSLNRRLIIKFLTSILLLFSLLLIVAVGLILLPYTDEKHGNLDPSELLSKLPNATYIYDNTVSVSLEVLQDIKESDGWLQILDDSGKEIFSFQKPETLPDQYSPGQLVYFNKFPNATGYKMYTWYSSASNQQLTWIYGILQNENSDALFINNYKTLLTIILLSLMLTIIIALVYGVRLGTPLLHILQWIDNISKGNYSEPLNKNGEPRSRRKSSDKLRASYETYKEIIMAIENLSKTLRSNEENKAILDKTREEWLAGVSHDIRTPLSSVKGYADLLVSNQYDFNREDVFSFGMIIIEKAAYIEELIEDMNLTFQLKNKALILKPEVQNIVELVRTSVIDYVNDQRYNGISLTLNNNEEENISYPIDSKWFKRAFENLLANALQYNDEGTSVTIEVEKLQEESIYPSVKVKIIDNGKGMDQDTLDHLFDKYFRGTNTDTPKIKGSGLGTAIAKQLIEAHNGSILVSSSLGEGTKIYITLPAIN